MNRNRTFTAPRLLYYLSAFALALAINFLLAYSYRTLVGRIDSWLWVYSILCASLVATATYRRWEYKRENR